MRLVEGPDALADAFDRAAAEAEAAFGDGTLYLEKAVVPARHVEIQVLCDVDGGVLTLGERECSIQRRHQKLVEESPSPALDAETREAMEATAERACRALEYTNAGTSPRYDSLVAKVIVWGWTRPAAIERTLRALDELDLRGVATTRDVARDVVSSVEFRSGDYHTGFLAEAEGRLPALAAQ